MSLDSPTHKPWWDATRLEYNVRANILISGDAYIKKGTSFDNRILVIDKTGLTAGRPVENFVADYRSLVDVLAGIPKNIRKFNIENKQNERVTGNSKDEAGQTGDVLQPKSTSTPTADVSSVQRGDTGRPGPEYVRPGRPGTGSTGTLDLFGQGSTGNVTANKTGQNTGDKGQAPKAKQGGRNKGITDNGSSLGRTEPDIRPLSQSIENRPGREIQGGGISVIRTEKKASKNLETIGYDEYSPEISVEGAKHTPQNL